MMETNFTRYIWTHTSRQQLWILFVVLISMIPYYLAFDLPKMLINGPITGAGFEGPGAMQPFLPAIAFINLELDRQQTLVGLSIAFLALVIVNGLFKYYINTYKGLMGERLLRRVRFELIDRILRFLPGEFKRIKGAEISSMVKDEVEPMGGFTSEAFVQPVLLVGQALTALGFIFVQHFWLGLLALFMATIQMVFIPRLRRRLLVLGRERQIGARQLAGRVTEIVDGIETIHTNDTSNYERADIASRLGNLFGIRYEIYTRKFKIKFLNNFLAQVTPFLFYLVGGYLAINNRLDVGQLVAVITAYKELPGPLKQLIDWDMARQDVQVKYETLVQQFDAQELIDPVIQSIETDDTHTLDFPLVAKNISMEDEGGSPTLDHVTLTLNCGEYIAVIGDAYSGANLIAEAFGGIAKPVKGKLMAGKSNLLSLPESITGRRISYASADVFFFSGSLQDNLLYGLKNRPIDDFQYTEEAAVLREWQLLEARRTGNPVFDLNSTWIDMNAVSRLSESDTLVEAMRQVLGVAHLSDDVFEFALYSTIDVNTEQALADQVVSMRKAVRKELDESGLGALINPFDVSRYNSQAKVLDNILFGLLTPKGESNTDGVAYFRSTLRQTGLDEQLFRMGCRIVDESRNLLNSLADDHPQIEQFDLFDLDDLPKLWSLYSRIKEQKFAKISAEDQYTLINLSFMYVECEHRFGLLNDVIAQNVIATRKLLHTDMPEELREGIEIYDPESYLPSANLLDNIIFGKIDYGSADVIQQLREAIAPLFEQRPELYMSMYATGLNYNVGPAGRRLSVTQRQKLNIARALMRRSDVYLFNRPTSGLDQDQQQQIVASTLTFLSAQPKRPAVLWVQSSEADLSYFDRQVFFKDKKVIEQQPL